MAKLTTFQVLDRQFPGLEREVRQWLNQGLSCEHIATQLFEKYQVTMTAKAVSYFRTRYWVRERSRQWAARYEGAGVARPMLNAEL